MPKQREALIRWCQEQRVSAKTYHRWEQEVLAEAGQVLAVQECRESPAFVEVRAAIGVERAPGGGEGTGMVAARLHKFTAQQYRWLMEGLEVEQPKAHKPVSGLKIQGGKFEEKLAFQGLYGMIRAMKEQKSEIRNTETIAISRAGYDAQKEQIAELQSQNEWLLE